ncbi:MAG: 4Fe-4S dicluster domain-containing protein [Candidatus Omnitrophota bacterium]
MTIKTILKSDVKELLKQVAGEWKTYAPVDAKGGDTLFSCLPKKGIELEKVLDKVNLGDTGTVISPKDVFFPQIEEMFTFEKENIEEKVETSKKLIFGVKPCDMKGIHFVDEFFKKNTEDIYYLSRVKNRVIVVIGCLAPPRPEACFCVSAKTGPFLKGGFDLQMVDNGGEYIVEVASDNGEKFVNSYAKFFKDTDVHAADKAEKIKTSAAHAIKVKVDFDKALDIMKSNPDLEENYKRISERCLYCGGCVYTCPTCTCFNVFDDKKGDKGTRKRIWDACIFEGYTREASQHNPRKEKSIRTRRRYEHKLKYDYKVNGLSGCVACGRCLASCPVNIGMSKFIEEITTDKRIV